LISELRQALLPSSPQFSLSHGNTFRIPLVVLALLPNKFYTLTGTYGNPETFVVSSQNKNIDNNIRLVILEHVLLVLGMSAIMFFFCYLTECCDKVPVCIPFCKNLSNFRTDEMSR